MLKLCAPAHRIGPCLTHFCTPPMRFPVFRTALSLFVGVALPVVGTAAAQATPAPAVGGTLSLADAVAIARRSNPSYQSTLNSRRTAAAQVRSATGSFLPSLSSSFSGDYREGRTQLINGTAFGATNNTMSTSGSIGTNYQLSSRQFSDRKAAKAGLQVTEADIGGAEQTLRVAVTTQYIAVLQAQARAVLQDTLLVTTAAQLELARAKLQVGSGIQLDVERAEVTNGQQRVAALQAHNQVDIAKVALFQQMGIAPVLGTQLEPLTMMELPSLTLDQIMQMASRSNPVIESNRAREKQSEYLLTSARRAYFPTLGFSAGLSGYTNRFTDTEQLILQSQSSVPAQRASCVRSEEVRAALGLSNNLAACSGIQFTTEQENSIRQSQSKYPFGFTRNPYGISASLSLPIFNGFQREAQIENANVQRRNAQNSVREQELKVSADVTTAWLTLTTSQQTVALQEQNARTARSALALAQERYRVGSISQVELITSRSDFDRAETDRINAIYEFQRAFVQLEAAVGRPLR